MCEYVIGEVDQVISDKKNEEEIREALDKICYKLRFLDIYPGSVD